MHAGFSSVIASHEMRRFGLSIAPTLVIFELILSLLHYFSLVDTMARLSLRAEARRFYLSYFWWVLEPLLYVAVFWFVFEYLLGTRTPDFLMFLAVGKLAFIWFSKTVNYAANSVAENAGLIGRMDIPKTLFPLAVILECSYRQVAVFALLMAVILLDGRPPTMNWLWLLPLAALQLLLIIACGFFASILVVVSRDFAPLINLGMVFLMFVSGVFWDLNELPNTDAVNLLMTINPLAFLLNSYRQVLLWQQTPDFLLMSVLAAATIVAIAFLTWLMNRFSKQIARRVMSQ